MRYSLPPKLDDPNLDAETAPATTSTPPPSPSQAPQGSVSAEHDIKVMPAETQRRIAELYAKLDRVDHYHLLGVTATADTKTIKRAYFALAKEHHPDRWFRKDIGSLRGKVEAIFNAMTAAEATLTNAEKRAAYDAYLRDVLKTRINRRQAAALEASNEWAGAAEIWRRVVEQLPTEAYVQHRYARALLRARSGYEAAMAAATRAIELDSTRAEYRITAAYLNHAEGRDRSALAQLTIALEIEPDRADLAGLSAALAERLARARSSRP
jgi:curved DNA-binding protein CbpA